MSDRTISEAAEPPMEGLRDRLVAIAQRDLADRALTPGEAAYLVNALDALRYIAGVPEPLNNKNSALNQCAWLKERAYDALTRTALPSPESSPDVE